MSDSDTETSTSTAHQRKKSKKPVTKLTRFAYVLKKSDFSKEFISRLKSDLTVKPYKPGNYGKFAKDTSFCLYVETKTHIGIPKHYAIEKIGPPTIDKLESYAYPRFKMKYNGELRPNQKLIVKKVLKGFETVHGGLLIAGCGIGKTNMAIWLACHLGLKTLFIVHKEFLMKQFINRVKAFTNVQTVGIIQQKKVDTNHPFVAGMVQSLARRDYDDAIFKDFGLIIIDEVHHMAARNYSTVFKKLTSKRMLGITAETERNDKLFKVINWYMGPVLHLEPQKPNDMVVVKKFYFMTKKTELLETIYNKYTKEVDRSTMITKLCEIKRRNRFILNLILELYDQEKKILCLSGRICQIELLFELLEANPLTKGNVGMYVGGTKDAKLAEASRKQIILGSYDMASEGLDIPDLNVELLLTPKSTIKQCVGRILRKDVYTEHPIVIDFVDDNDIFKGQAKRRTTYYGEQHYNIQEFKVSDYELKGHAMWNDMDYIKECLLKAPDPVDRAQWKTERKKFEPIKPAFDSDSDDFDCVTATESGSSSD